jgi:hypothetical protein
MVRLLCDVPLACSLNVITHEILEPCSWILVGKVYTCTFCGNIVLKSKVTKLTPCKNLILYPTKWVCFNLFCNVWVCICVGVCMCGFCNVWVYLSVGFVIYGCVYVWVFW